jgi:hypothetical protein
MEASVQIPPIGTPEFRAFVQTQEWRDFQYDEALAADPAETERAQAEIAARQPLDSPTIQIGLTGLCSPKVWSRDFRERFPVDHPYRLDYEETIHGLSERDLRARDLVSLGVLHRVALQCTVVDR